ncbi:hypothetical protein CDD81_3015 [Ophiocordyceps australis]|uniref:Elongin-A n=1 Tax=Ophiocordyceps australis TaxID=1399860 RepID=A0A2C5YHQ7_9HYPO|nr:hypothetical protein CDD81_3015 [Ophiocordyceps australis]
MPLKSLFELATSACLQHIKEINSIGDFLPYPTMRHILTKIESANQLHQIELNSPQIQGETGEIWTKIIENDFPLEYRANTYLPSSPDKWYRVWQKYKREHDAALKQSEEQLKSALLGLQEDKEKNVSKIVERKHLPPAGRTKRFPSRDAGTSRLTFASGSRTKTHNGSSVMKRVRREVQEIATIHGALSRAVRAPIRSAAAKPPASAASATAMAYHGRRDGPSRATVLNSDDEDNIGYGDTKSVASDAAKKRIVNSAKVSLLKKKPEAVGGITSASKTLPARTHAQNGNTVAVRCQDQAQDRGKAQGMDKYVATTKMTGRGAATLANKFGRRPSKPQIDFKPHNRPSALDAQDDEDLGMVSVPSSTTPLGEQMTCIDTLAAMSPTPLVSAPKRKRKAVDHFIRPKKNRTG